MKTIFLIPLLVLLSACCRQKNAMAQKNTDRFVLKQRTIRVDFHPYKSIRYQDYLIIQGKDDKQNFCFEVYDLKTGKTDTTFYQQIALDSIHGFMIRNEQLMTCSTNNQWKVWNNGVWQAWKSYSDFFFSQEIKQEYSQMLKFLHEDTTYFVYAVSLGEFGGGAFFYHKPSGKTYSFQHHAPLDVLKSKEGYELSISLAHSAGYVSLVTIHDPLKLELVPEELNFLKYEFGKKEFQLVYDFWKSNEQRNLSFGLFFKQFTMDELTFELEAYEQYNSLLKHDPNFDFKLDTIGMGDDFLCHGSLSFKEETIYLLQDSILYLGQIKKGKLKRIQDFPEQPVLPYYPSIVEHKNGSHSYSLWTHRAYKDHDLTVNHAWLSVSGTTIYRYNIVRKN
jgi:hypothetical protein